MRRKNTYLVLMNCFCLFIPSEEKLSAVLEMAQTLADSASPAARPGTANRDHPSNIKLASPECR